jgi:hypothetical protein
VSTQCEFFTNNVGFQTEISSMNLGLQGSSTILIGVNDRVVNTGIDVNSLQATSDVLNTIFNGGGAT